MSNSPYSIYHSQYPDPFLDIASTRLPKSRQKLIEMCKVFALTHPQLSPIVKKVAKYPITKIVVKSTDNNRDLEKRWKDILENNVDIYQVAEEFGLDYIGTGNAAIHMNKPFVRVYECKVCKVVNESSKVKFYVNGTTFTGQCPTCKKNTRFKPIDQYLEGEAAIKNVSVVRTPVEDLYIKFNPLTNDKMYYRNVPSEISSAIKKNKPDKWFIDTTPTPFLIAALSKKKIVFEKGKLAHFKNPTISGKEMGYGLPDILAGLKDAYLNQIYKKADETVANERTVPARFVYPQATSQDPMRTISLSKFATYMSNAIRRYRYDKNAIMPFPFPVGVAELGGDAQRLFTSQLRELTVKDIIGATGMPEGFLSDGMTWSGGSVQLRMLENSLMGYTRALNKMLKFVVTEIAKIADLPMVDVIFKPFRMQDDIQMLQILMSLAQMNQVSFRELLSRLDLDWDQENGNIMEEVEKLNRVEVKKAMKDTLVMVESAKLNVEMQNRQQSHEQMSQEMIQHATATSDHLTQTKDYESSSMDVEQQQAEAEQNQPEDPKDEYLKTQTNVMKVKYEEESKESKFYDSIAEQLINLSEQEQQKRLANLSARAPEVYKQVAARLKQMQEGSYEPSHDVDGDDAQQPQQQAPEQEEQQDPKEQAKEQWIQIKQTAKNPEEIAEQLIMMPGEIQLAIFDILKRENPVVLGIVTRKMRSMTGGGGNQVGSAVDMTQLPQAKPPRRKS